MKRGYDSLTTFSADEFDQHIKISLPHYNDFHDETINLVKAIKPDPGVWIDTGCGTGSLIKKAAEHFPGASFILSDPASDMLSIAEKKLSGYNNIQILKPSSTIDIQTKATRPDIITAIQSHHYLDAASRKQTTEKCYNLLVDGGLYVCFENIRPENEKGIEIGKRYWKMHQISQGRDEESAERHIRRFDTVYFPITIAEHLRLYREIGFSIVELFWYSYMQAGFYCLK